MKFLISFQLDASSWIDAKSLAKYTIDTRWTCDDVVGPLEFTLLVCHLSSCYKDKNLKWRILILTRWHKLYGCAC